MFDNSSKPALFVYFRAEGAFIIIIVGAQRILIRDMVFLINCVLSVDGRYNDTGNFSFAQ